VAGDELLEMSVPVQFTVGSQGMAFSPKTGMVVLADYVGVAETPEPVGAAKRTEQVAFRNMADPAPLRAPSTPEVPWWIEHWWTMVAALIGAMFLARRLRQR
jgi:hypothetical protein